MSKNLVRYLKGKVIIRGILKSLTGLHIGASKEVVEIGAEDLPVVRNPITREPYIPGSSLKGKLRALSERHFEKDFNRKIKENIFIHSHDDAKEALECEVCRLFGSTGKDGGSNFPSRLKVRDSFLTEYSKEELEGIEEGLLYTEVKFENVLDRVTASATPRQIERIPAGAEFSFEIVYDVEDKKIEEDLINLLTAMELLEDDYLGGHGSRGYGKVKFFIAEGRARKIEYYKSEKGENERIVKKENLPEFEELIRRKEENIEEKLYTVKEFKSKIKEIVKFFGFSE